MSVFDAINEYEYWPPSKFQEPKLVAHGIQLKKGLSEIAGNWWSQRWFKIIDEFGLGVRWERAKLYATRGQVLSIEIENGLVNAGVQGSGDDPYRVMISVKTIPKAIWSAILQDLGKTSSFAIALSSGVLPAEDQISQVFQDNGVLLFPDRQGELHTKCTCLDWSNPCKHIAAVYLLLGAEFDRDPYLLFKLRGLEQSEFFKQVQSNSTEVYTGNAETGPNRETDRLLNTHNLEFRQLNLSGLISDLDHHLSDEPYPSEQDYFRQFWRNPLFDPRLLGQWNLPSQTASLPASLGEFPFWQGNENFLDGIDHVYEVAPEHANTVLAKTKSSF